MKVVVFGGRNYKNRARVFAELDALHRGPRGPITYLIEGGAQGADLWGLEWRRENFVQGRTFDADWRNLDAPGAVIKTDAHGRQYNARAGFDRNQQMVDTKPDLGIGFPGKNGTADMAARLHKAGIEVIEIDE